MKDAEQGGAGYVAQVRRTQTADVGRKENHMFRTVLIIFGLIMFAILATVYQARGIPGSIVMGAVVPHMPV